MNQGLEIMLAELESNCLEVVLVPCKYPCNVGGCNRVAISKNADWYRRYCAQFPSSRIRNKSASDTRIKRAATLRILNALIDGKPVQSKYAEPLLKIAAKIEAENEEAPF